MIENRNLEIGTRLVATYKKVQHICTVEAGENGEGIAFVLADGKRFKEPLSRGGGDHLGRSERLALLEP